MEACAEAAYERGMAVLEVRGDELVMESSFAAVRELLWREVRASGRTSLDGAARLAAPVFDDGGAERVDADRAAGVLHGLYWLVANLADHGPLLLLIDDAHWLDAASARFLVYLARRVDSLPVLLTVGVRRGEGADPVGLAAVLPEVAACVLAPKPLSEDATGVVVRRKLGARADEELCAVCHEATGGNPFYLHELTAALHTEPGRPTVDAARRVRVLGSGALGRSVLGRLARLGADCEQLAQAMAVLAPGSPLRHGAKLGGLERDRAELAADRLRAADLLTAGRALAFAHPIVREAVAAEMAPSRRAALHATAASLLAGDGAPAGMVAAHLLSAEPYGEAWIVDALRAAARQALARGAPEAAVSYLRRALAEPPAPSSRLAVVLELGRAEALLPIRHDFAALREASSSPIRRSDARRSRSSSGWPSRGRRETRRLRPCWRGSSSGARRSIRTSSRPLKECCSGLAA